MSDGVPAPSLPAGADGAQAAEPAAPVTPEAPPALHDSWVRALDESGIPDMLRGETTPLMQQIRRSEREANERIEQAQAARAPEAWQQLITQAGDTVTPQELVEAYNAREQIRADPFGFIDSYTRQVNALVQSGELTAPEGWAARYRGALEQGATQQQAADFADQSGVTNPEDERLARIEQRLQQEDQRRQQEAEQTRLAQEEADADAYADRFEAFLDDRLAAAGFAAAGQRADEGTRAMVGTIAGRIIDADETGRMDFDQAIPLAIQQVVGMITARGGQVAAAAPAAPTAALPPVGGGSNAALTPAHGFETKDARIAAMVAAGRAALANG